MGPGLLSSAWKVSPFLFSYFLGCITLNHHPTSTPSLRDQLNPILPRQTGVYNTHAFSRALRGEWFAKVRGSGYSVLSTPATRRAPQGRRSGELKQNFPSLYN